MTTQLLLFLLSIIVAYKIAEVRFMVEVKGTPPESLPVVVITSQGTSGRHRASVVYYADLPLYKAAYTQYSLVIPRGEEEVLRAQIESATRSNGADSRFWFATFRVRTRGDGVQELEVVGMDDDDFENKSWYEVHGSSIVPLRYLNYFGPGVGWVLGMPCLAGALVLNVALWVGGGMLLHRGKGKGRPTSART